MSFNVFIATGAVRLAITAFIVPFAFVYGDGLLMVGDWQTIQISCVTAVIGVLTLSFGIEGYFRGHLAALALRGGRSTVYIPELASYWWGRSVGYCGLDDDTTFAWRTKPAI